MKIIIAILDGSMEPVNPNTYTDIKLKLFDPDNKQYLIEEIGKNSNKQLTLEKTFPLSSKTGMWKAYIGLDGKFEEVLKFHVKEMKLSPFKVFVEPFSRTFGIDDMISMIIFAQHNEANTFVQGKVKLTYSIYDSNYLNNPIDVKEEIFEISRKKTVNRNVSSLEIPKDMENVIVKLGVEVTEIDSQISEKTETFLFVQLQNFVIKNLNQKHFFVHGSRYDFTAEIKNLDGSSPEDQTIKLKIEESYIDDCEIYDDTSRPIVEKKILMNETNLIDGKVSMSFRPSAQAKRLKIVFFYNGIEKSFVIPEFPGEPSDNFGLSIMTSKPRIGKRFSALVTSKLPIGQLSRFAFSEHGYIQSVRELVDDDSFAFNMETSKSTSNFLFVEQSNSLKFGSFQIDSNQIQEPEHETENLVIFKHVSYCIRFLL